MHSKYLKPLVVAFLFTLSSTVAIFSVLLFLLAFEFERFDFSTGKEFFGDNVLQLLSPYLGIIAILGALIAVLGARVMNMTDFKHSFDCKGMDWKRSWIPLTGAVFYIVVLGAFVNVIGLTDIATANSYAVTRSFLGAAALCVICPVCEELVFREAIIRYMLAKGATELQVIFFSSFCFAIAHVTLPRVFFAFFAGLVLAALYVKTRNIVLSSVVHIINNIVGVVCMYQCGVDYQLPLVYSIAILILLPYPTYILLRRFLSF